MEIVKKNILSIICGVIVIAAVVVYFVWVSGKLYPDLDAAARERKSQYETLNNLLGKTRNMPVIELKSSEPVPLPVFPTLPVIQHAKEVTSQLSAQSKQILKMASDLNRHEPLVPGVFPKPNDQTKLIFRDAYGRFVNEEIALRLKAASPPTEEEVAAEEEKLWNEKYAKKVYYVNGVEANRDIVDQEFFAETQHTRENLEQKIAETHKVYLDKTAVTTNSAIIKTDISPPDAQVWYAQMATWVQMDLLDAIARLNAPAKSIIDAPVKHIVTVDVPQGAEMYFRITDTSIEGIQAGAQDFMSSPTGRTSGQVYDVIKFTLVLKMDAHYVPALIQEMARGKFITVHKVETSSVDSALARDDGFYYGEAPMVLVTMSGEALMLRDWTLKLVPEIVKKDLPGNTPAAGEGSSSEPVAAAH